MMTHDVTGEEGMEVLVENDHGDAPVIANQGDEDNSSVTSEVRPEGDPIEIDQDHGEDRSASANAPLRSIILESGVGNGDD